MLAVLGGGAARARPAKRGRSRRRSVAAAGRGHLRRASVPRSQGLSSGLRRRAARPGRAGGALGRGARGARAARSHVAPGGGAVRRRALALCALVAAALASARVAGQGTPTDRRSMAPMPESPSWPTSPSLPRAQVNRAARRAAQEAAAWALLEGYRPPAASRSSPSIRVAGTTTPNLFTSGDARRPVSATSRSTATSSPPSSRAS